MLRYLKATAARCAATKNAAPRAVMLALTVCLPGLLAIAPHALADAPDGEVVVMDARLDPARAVAGAVWTGKHAYVAGGTDGQWPDVDQIVRYTPGTDEADVVARLPSGRAAVGAAWNGTQVYLFGGWSSGVRLDEIVRYDPASGTVEVMTARLPTPRQGTAAFSDGQHVYVLGGEDASGLLDDVLRYDPATDTLERLPVTLPQPRATGALFWTGDAAYFIGGWSATGLHDTIVRFDPAGLTAENAPGRLPTPMRSMGVAWDGTFAYFSGGWDDEDTLLTAIYRYDPSSGAVQATGQHLPSGRGDPAAVWADDAAYFFGGNIIGPDTDEIVRFRPGTGAYPEAPANMTARKGAKAGEANLSWAPPADGAPAAYRVYRAADDGAFRRVAEVPGERTSHVDAGLRSGTYHYRVTAVDATGRESLPSNEATVQVEGPLSTAETTAHACRVAFSERVCLTADRILEPATGLADDRLDEVDARRESAEGWARDRIQGLAPLCRFVFADPVCDALGA